MTRLNVQTVTIQDCEGEIERGYYEWGAGFAEDKIAPAWDEASPEQRRLVTLRGYDMYDGWPPQLGNDLSATEAYVSIGINSFVILFDVLRYLSVADQARPLLEQIPDDATLEDAEQPAIDAAAKLITLLDGLRYFDFGKATKILHKKRPGLIPVIDSRVKNFLWKNFPHRLSQGSAIRKYLDVYKDILQARSCELAAIRSNLAAGGIHLTTGRVLSYLIWKFWPNDPTIVSVWGTTGQGEAKRLAKERWGS